MEKKGKGYLSLKSTILLCLCLAALVIIGDKIRDEVVGKSHVPIVDLSSQCHRRPIETVLKNTDGTECLCQLDGDCTKTGCIYDGDGLNKTETILTCCTSWQQQCIVYNPDGTKKAGCCVTDPKKPGSFLCNAESKNCTVPCQQGSVPGSGCRFGRKKYCCEFDDNYDADMNIISGNGNGTSNETETDIGLGYCSIVGPECSPCLYKGHKVKDLTPCTNADGTKDAEGCCYDGTCMLKSCPKLCTIRNEPANEGQVCDPPGGGGAGCCSNGTCVHIDAEGKCPSPCRGLQGTVVAEGKSCSTIFGTENGICIKGFCLEMLGVGDNTSEPSSPFKKLSLLQNEPEEEYILSQRL